MLSMLRKDEAFNGGKLKSGIFVSFPTSDETHVNVDTLEGT